MKSTFARLDRFISQRSNISRRDVRGALAKKRIRVDGVVASEANLRVGQFSHVTLDDVVLQDKHPVYIMMNKPKGVVSATKDDKNKTVFDLLSAQENLRTEHDNVFTLNDLHIVGRLDFNTSGLILITNDGHWSRRLSLPERQIAKHYQVKLDKPLTQEYIDAFAEGMHFPYEDIVTRPVHLKIISDYMAEVSLVEGRYHQIKRMFGRFQNTVVELHRMAVGELNLDDILAPGASRFLTLVEVERLKLKD